MSLKQLFQRHKLLNLQAIDFELTIPGEPLIYSIKYNVGARQKDESYFRNRKLHSILRCHFRNYFKTNIPVVLLIKFFVSPPSFAKISEEEIKKDNVPAVLAYEACDYLLSFLEMIHHVLINSYRQVVKVEFEKYYSLKPRTCFKFMQWSDYVALQNHNSLSSNSKTLPKNVQTRVLRTEEDGGKEDKGIPAESDSGQAKTEGPPVSDSPLPVANKRRVQSRKTQTAKLPTARHKARRRQLGEIS